MKLSSSGKYKYRANKGNFTTDHRLVMMKSDPREDYAGLVVHHIDGNKSNNSPDNLVWMTRSEHSRLHKIGENHFPCDGENNANFRHGMCVGGQSKEYKQIHNRKAYLKNREARIAKQKQYVENNREHYNWYYNLRNWKRKLAEATTEERRLECLVHIKELEANPK